MHPPLEIRRGTADDATAIARCYRRAYATAPTLGSRSRLTSIDAETVASWLTDDGITLVALDAGELVGTVRLCETGPIATLERIAVVPDAQRDGVGTALFDRAETLARDRGDDRLRLTTVRDHPFLSEWYRSKGYEPIGVPAQPGWDDEFVTMEKPLADAASAAGAAGPDSGGQSDSPADNSTSST